MDRCCNCTLTDPPTNITAVAVVCVTSARLLGLHVIQTASTLVAFQLRVTQAVVNCPAPSFSNNIHTELSSPPVGGGKAAQQLCRQQHQLETAVAPTPTANLISKPVQQHHTRPHSDQLVCFAQKRMVGSLHAAAYEPASPSASSWLLLLAH